MICYALKSSIKKYETMRQKERQSDEYDKRYSLEFVEKVLLRMSATNFGLKEACEFYNAEFIDFKLFLVENNDASKLYFNFKKKQVLSMQEYIEEQARDVESYLDSNGTRRVDAGMIGLANLRVKTYQWMLERLKPKFFDIKYIEEQRVEELSDSIKDYYKSLKEKYESEY